jgi:phthalate 4,5-cis-dihydrodiol dehydrogenase
MTTATIRLGVAGLGRAFTLMLPTFRTDPRVELVAACDPREAARAQFQRDFGAKTYADVEDLVADPAVQAVYIASPHGFHAAHTRLAAAAGRHVLVEKPMALTLAECDDMIAACAAAGVHLIVGHCHSFDTPYLAARELIGRGDLGRVRMIQALDYTDFLYRPRRPEELRTEEGGGVVFSQAAHQVDIVRLLAGSRATRVRAVLGAWDPSRPTEGAYTALLWFDDGVFATLTYSGYGHFDSDEWCGWMGELGMAKDPSRHGQARQRLRALRSPDEEAKLKHAGTYGGPAYAAPSAGAQQANQHFGPVVVACEHGDLRPLPDALMVYGDERVERIPLAAPAVPRFEVIDELVVAVHDGKRPLHSGQWARGTQEICLAMLRSAREGRDVALEPQAVADE